MMEIKGGGFPQYPVKVSENTAFTLVKEINKKMSSLTNPPIENVSVLPIKTPY